jgi:hypothetical protein
MRDPEGKFWFLTNEAQVDKLELTTVSSDELRRYFSLIPGKAVVFVDACYAGKLAEGDKPNAAQGSASPQSGLDSTIAEAATGAVSTPKTGELPTLDLARVIKDSAGPGLAVLSSTAGAECSLESPAWDNHSAFAMALIEAVGEGKASNDSSGRITIKTLNQYVAGRVSELTGGAQHTVLSFPNDIPDYPIALARP